MANNQHNPNMMVHSTNGLVDTTSSQSNDENHSRQGNNVAGSGNILERAITNNVFASSSSSSSSVLLPSVPASASSTVHALADSVMIPFSASDLDVLRASLAATNSLNNNNSNNDNTSGVLTSNPSDSSNINVCINGGNIIVNSDGHLTLDGATNAVLNGISSSNMVGVGIPNISVSVTQAAASSDLLHSSSNEISSNSGVNGLDPHQQQHRRMNNIVSNNQFFNASSSNNSGLDSNSVNDGNRMRNAGHIINNSNDNKNGGGVVSGASNPISIAGILANVNIDESGMVAAASNGFMPHAQNSNGVDSNQNAGGSSLSQNYATLRNQISSVKSSSNNSNASKPLYKSGRSLLSGNSNSLLQQHLKRDIAGGGISGSGNSLIGSSIGIVSGGGNSGSSIVERTATANIHHHASGRSNISSSSASSSGKRISLPSQMNLGGRVVSSSDSNGTINARAGTSQQGQAGPSSSSSIWLQQQQHQAPQNQHILSASQQNGSGLASQGPIRVNSSSTLTSSTVNLDQHGGEGGVVSISIAGDLPQQQIVQLGSAPNSSFQSQNQAFSGLFQIPVQQEEASVTFQAAAHSTFDQQTAGPSNLNIHQYRDLAVGGDSEAIPSYPSIQQPPYQIMASDNSIAESLNGAAAPTVDSSSIQSYNLVYDTETKKLTVQRVISPSDSTVSQSTLEGSEATPNPALMPTVSQGGYAMVQVNPMPSAFSQGGSGAAAMAGGSGASSSGGGGGEVSTSSMGVVLGLDDHRASSSALGGSIDSRLSSSSSSAARNIVVLHHKLEDNSLDTAECDTTQEDVEFQHPQTPPPYSLTGASNSIDDNEVTSLDSSMPDTPVSSLTHRRMMNHHIMRGQGSSSLSSSTRDDVMDATLNSSGLSSVVAMDTTEGHSVINMDTGQASSLSSSSTPVVSQQHHHQRPKQQHHHQTNGQLMQAAIDILPSTSGLQAFDATAMAGPSHMYSENQQDETMPQSSGLGMNVRKSRRLELQEQEPRASQRKKDYSYRTQSYSVNLLWCDECMLSYDFECPTHRPSPVVDKMVLSRAWASCPTQLQICRLVDTAHESSESAMGVFAKRQIGKLTQFGPFVGKLVDTLDEVASCAFPLMVEMESGAKKYFDTSDENLCNWMMFVRPAKTFAEQNMVAFQHKEHVYFTVTKMIESKQELKIWYAAHYAERLHLKPLELTEEDMQVLDESDAKFPCFECSRRFRSSAALQKHLEMVHENEDLLDLNVDGDGVKDGMYDDEDGDYKGTINGMDGRGRGGDEEGVGSRRRRKNKGVIIQGKLIQGKGKSRQRENFQWKKKSTSLYINKTLKKCKKRVQCSDKSPAFGRSSMYKRQGKDNGGNEWVCTHCGLTFDKRSLLNLHTLTHAAEDLVAGEEGMMQIDPANSQFNKVETNQEEGVILTLGPMIACPKCAVIFTDQRDLMNHVATHAQKPLVKREKPFECLYCSKSFQTEDKLTKHSIVHGADEDKPLECGVCQKRLVNNAAMACHMKTHSDRKYYDCPVCDEDFDSSLELREHGQKLHSDEKGHYPCHNCIKVFDDFQMLKRHIKAFHSTRVFECDFCSKEFSRFDKLKLHMLKHTPHREFMCDQCGRQFKRKDKLKEHTKRLHSKERIEEELKLKENGAQPTISKFVPKVMPSEYHRFIYKCHSCLLGFKRRGMLVNHLAKRHPDMKPEHVPELNLPILKTQKDFYCQYCDKIYKSSSKRKAHILKIHPGSLVPPSARKKLPLAEDGSATVNGNVLPSGITVGANGQQVLPPSSTFSHTVGSITTMPHGCKFCHKQYASKAKLLQHQRKKHTELVEPSSAKKKSKPFKSEYLQITVADPTVALINERYETVPMVTVVTQATPGADQLTGPADLLTQAMTEIQQSYRGDFATAINPRLSAGNNNATMVQIQPSSLGQTIDINQLNQALQSMTSVASQGGVTTVLAPPQHTSILAPPQQQQQQQLQQQQQQQQLQQQQQPHPIQLIANSANGNAHPSTQQLQPGVQLVAAGGPGIQTSTINLSGLGGSQFITSRNWPNSFTSQFS